MEKLYSAAAIDERVDHLARSLQKKLAGAPLVHMIVMMNGAFVFAADLVRKMDLPIVLHFAGGSYFEGNIKYEVSLKTESLPSSFGSAPVVLIEDILDGGKSIAKMRQMVADKNAAEIHIVSLLKRQGTEIKTDDYGFTIPNNMFVVGYGLDMDGRFRNLPDIYHLASSSGMTGLC